MSEPKPPAAKPPATKPRRRPRTPKNAFALPVRAADAPPVPDFAPVPRVYNRHDGWTPARQRAFIGALADTGCVSRAARMVNMAQANCYTLRRSPGAEEFRRAWDAALDCGLAQMKDIAFERAIEGELIPVFAGGKLMGHRRKRNDALLMFCLRHYGKDASGKRTTINYFSSRASACASTGSTRADVALSVPSLAHPEPVSLRDSFASEGSSGAEASATTVTTVITGGGSGAGRAENDDEAAGVVNRFEGVVLDAEARASIMAALEACAERARAADAAYSAGGAAAADMAEDDPGEVFVPHAPNEAPWRGTLEPPVTIETSEPPEGEDLWTMLGAEKPEWLAEPEEHGGGIG